LLEMFRAKRIKDAPQEGLLATTVTHFPFQNPPLKGFYPKDYGFRISS